MTVYETHYYLDKAFLWMSNALGINYYDYIEYSGRLYIA